MSNAKVPSVRFPGYEDDWQAKQLKQVAEINPRAEQLPESFIYIDLDCVKNGRLLKQNKIKKHGAPSRAQRLLTKDDILFQTVRPYQKNNFFFNGNNYDFVASTGYAQIRTREYPLFLYHYLHTNNFVDKVLVRSTGTNYPAINSSDLAKISVSIPHQEEQKKIAGFLGSVDEKIGVIEKKIELSNSYKKSLLQKLFPRTGQANPDLRFKKDDGSDFPDWQEKKLGDLIIHKGGTALEPFVAENGKYKFISIGNYTTDGRYIDNSQRINDVNQKIHERILNQNDLVMVLNDKTTSGDIIGSTILIDTDDGYVYNQRSEKIKPNSRLIDTVFLWHKLNSPAFRKAVFSISQGGTQIYVNFPSVKKLIVTVPAKEEQQKIAGFLSSLDDRIKLQEGKLEQAKQFKKALLQQMFAQDR